MLGGKQTVTVTRNGNAFVSGNRGAETRSMKGSERGECSPVFLAAAW
jgi:hypothetical protein